MENTKKEELLEEFFIIETLVKDNPCGISENVINSLKTLLNDFIGRHCIQGASREQIAKYFHKDIRTISRWKNEFPDFPEGKIQGKKEITYNWIDVIRWKISHSDLFTDQCP